MSYVHGLGDAQEALSIQEDRENDWISSIKITLSLLLRHIAMIAIKTLHLNISVE